MMGKPWPSTSTLVQINVQTSFVQICPPSCFILYDICPKIYCIAGRDDLVKYCKTLWPFFVVKLTNSKNLCIDELNCRWQTNIWIDISRKRIIKGCHVFVKYIKILTDRVPLSLILTSTSISCCVDYSQQFLVSGEILQHQWQCWHRL